MDEFQRWLRASGFWWDETAIELGSVFPSRNADGTPHVGVRALRDLAEGETVALMPVSRCLTRSACAHADAVLRLRDDIGDDAQWLAALGAALLLERLGLEETDVAVKNETDGAEKNADTYARLSGYVASLPVREPNVVGSWPETRRRFLAGTDVERALRCERAAAKNEWEQFVERRVKEAALLESGAASSFAKSKLMTFEAYLDARSVVSSRAFHVTDDQGPGLVPIADLFNHESPGSNHVAMRLTDEEDFRGGKKVAASRASKLAAVVVKSVSKGEEVFNTYGALGNATLLNSYGFTLEHNPLDTVSVSVPDLRAAAAMRGAPGHTVAARLSKCFEKKSLAPFSEESLFPLKRGEESESEPKPPTALLVALWAVTATDEAFAKAEREIDEEDEEDAKRSTVSRAAASGKNAAASAWRAAAEKAEVSGSIVTVSASEVFLEILDRRRRMYVDVPVDVREDESLRDADGAGWRAGLRILVESERAVVDAHALATERRLAAIVAEENDDTKRRKKINVRVAEAADAFALFD